MRRTSIEKADNAQGLLLETKIRILHGVILSNQQLIHAQTHQISALKKQLQMERERKKIDQMQGDNNNGKVTVNSEHIPISINIQKECTIDRWMPCGQCSQRIRQLQSELVATKLKLAEQFSNSLEQHITIQSLHKEHLILSEELEMFSNKSQQEETGQNTFNEQSPSNNIKQEEIKPQLINKGNIGFWITNINDQQYQPLQQNTLYYQHSTQLNTLHHIPHLNQAQLESQFKQVLKQNYTFKSSQSSQTSKLFKLWYKHIQKQRKRLHKYNLLSSATTLQSKSSSFQSTFHSIFNLKNSIDKETFSDATFPLLIKYYGVPIQLRSIVWALLINDKLALTRSLYSKLCQKSVQLNGTELSVKQQIRKDMVRSFNGECSVNNLLKIYIKTHKLININSSALNITHLAKQVKRQQSIQKHQQNQQHIQKLQYIIQKRQELQQNQSTANRQNIQGQQIAGQIVLVRKQTIETTETQAIQGGAMIQTNQDFNTLSLNHKSISINSNYLTSQSKRQAFPIQELATRTLEIFSLYRPDIGFIQGMTYPTIILTLILQQYDVFRVLSNVLLTRQFFLKMITVEEGFVDTICRVFEDMLYERNSRLHDRLVRDLAVRSEVYVVDWFWTFYSRNLSPTVILKIWDLIIYQYSMCSPHPELILFQMALTILQLLSPILHQTNYQQTIKTIREYWRKIDENEMIEKLYEGIRQWDQLQKLYRRGFEKMSKKIRARGHRRD